MNYQEPPEKYTWRERGKFIFWVGQYTIELYYPYAYWNKLNIVASARTSIVIFRQQEYNDWMVTRSFVIAILGFGFGIAYKHIDNPNLAYNVERFEREKDKIDWKPEVL